MAVGRDGQVRPTDKPMRTLWYAAKRTDGQHRKCDVEESYCSPGEENSKHELKEHPQDDTHRGRCRQHATQVRLRDLRHIRQHL